MDELLVAEKTTATTRAEKEHTMVVAAQVSQAEPEKGREESPAPATPDVIATAKDAAQGKEEENEKDPVPAPAQAAETPVEEETKKEQDGEEKKEDAASRNTCGGNKDGTGW